MAALASAAAAGVQAVDVPATGRVAAGAAEDKVELNSASSERLQTVPGIGPSLAARIIAFRQEHGPFERVEDLLKVRGIGERSLEKIRPYVVVRPSEG